MPPSATSEDSGARSVPIRDAASLLVVREGATPYVLMGKRSQRHVFMPNKYVFPGGRVDAADQRLRVPHGLAAAVEDRLLRKSRLNRTRAQALALAAIRETFEETGVIVGQAQQASKKARTASPAWRAFFAHGATPGLAQLDFIGRAITPPNRVRRYDTRFFLAYADDIFVPTGPAARPSGELLHIQWVPLAKAQSLDLPIITRHMLQLCEERLRLKRARRTAQTAWFFRELAGKPRTEEL